MYKSVKPFIKWAGGKSQLLDDIRKKYPDKIDKYCEPFVGGGAVLLDVLANFSPEQVLINDINPELTNTYTKIRENVEEIIDFLEKMQSDFWALDQEARKTYYYDKRDRFNDLILQPAQTAEQAALFIFLNKTCFNGLYRVNAKGLYNVPMGDYKKPPISDPDNLRLISGLLNTTEIKCGEYKECEAYIDANTFVYIDPPYRPLNETSSFTSYAKTEFGDQQQIELGHFVDEITAKGAKVVVSNSDPKNTDESDDFFDIIYGKYIINRVQATRMINSKSSGRGALSELLICNY